MDEAKGVDEEVCQDSEFFCGLAQRRVRGRQTFLYTQHKKGISAVKNEKRETFFSFVSILLNVVYITVTELPES